MSTIQVQIKNIKNISECSIEVSLEKGIYAFVGTNGCGKSTLMSILSLLVKPSTVKSFVSADVQDDSEVILAIGENSDKFITENNKLVHSEHVGPHWKMHLNFRGFYEGSIFYGTRFYDYAKIPKILGKDGLGNDLRPGDDFVKESLSYILHGDKSHYATLQKIRTKKIARDKYRLSGMPYFFTSNGNLISQYSMSSGECMLISLIDFINNLLNFISLPDGSVVLFLIDEVELALHPSAIDRLIEFVKCIIDESKHDIIVFFSTHSSEVIQKIPPKNLYLLENNDGILDCINPCYANYAIRNLYVPNGFDYLILVEDELSKALVEKVLREKSLKASKLICVLPGGGWSQLLKLHYDIIKYNALGVGRKIVSIYDGDVRSVVNGKEEYKHLPKSFLPIGSIEKYLYSNLVNAPDRQFIKLIGDKYFNVRSINDVIDDFKINGAAYKKPDKALYKMILVALSESGINEHDFIKYLCDDIYDYEKTSIQTFTSELKRLLT